MRMGQIARGFVAIDEGQVHYRTAGTARTDAPPLVMFHASPGSAKMLEPLIAALAAHRQVFALDTLGNGDSSPPAMREPDIAYFTDAHRRAIDALGITRFDAYGTHTGANVAVELAIQFPQRVRKIILDGVSIYTEAERADMLTHHTPEIEVDALGTYLTRVWHFVRDGFLFWPWYKRGPENTRGIGLPPPDALYDKTLEVLKAVRTYHLPYRAAIRYPKAERLPLVRVPTLYVCAKTDMLIACFDAVRALMPAARAEVTEGVGSPATLAATVALYRRFLDSDR